MDTLILKPDSENYLDIILTNIQLHTQKARNPNSLGRQYVKAIHGSEIRRAYSNSISFNKNGGLILSMDLGMEYYFDMARKQGKKIVRFFTLKNGVPVELGNDVTKQLNLSIDKS